MAIVMGPNGQLVNTSNINSSVIGSSLIPNITPNIGALNTIDKPVTNDDGTITLPTIEMRSNDPGLEAGQLQKMYGTDLMPYFNWVDTYQTGTMTYDPTDDNSAAELEAINEEFKAKHGVSAQEAAAQMEAEMKKVAIKSATMATTYGAGKAAQAYLGDSSIGFGGAALEGIKSISPFKGIGGSPQVAPQAQYGIVGSDRTFANIQDAKAYTDAFKGTEIKDLGPQKPVQSALQAGKSALQGSKTGFAGFQDRLYGDAAAANFKVTGAAAGIDFITQVAMGADPMDAAKDAGKTAVLSYVANAIIPGSGPIIGFLSKFF